MELFYSTNIDDNTILLDEIESTHCLRVLRHKTGDSIEVTDGIGHRYSGIISAASKICKVEITEKHFEQPLNKQLHIAIAPPKSIDRFEWFLEKSTELGIETITPLLCRYSERKHINAERCGKIILAAMKQSNRVYLPVLNEMISLEKFITIPSTAKKLIAHCEESEKLTLEKSIAAEQVIVLIGPEGDFAPHEIKLAIDAGYENISLGEKRLRTETAALHVCSAFALKNRTGQS
jgi:16S rRNA (uracil1498-N3)-methyltransferase